MTPPTPLVSVSTAAEDALGTALTVGSTIEPTDQLVVNFSAPVTVAASWSMSLTDGQDVGSISSSDSTETVSNGGQTVTFDVGLTAPTMSTGTGLIVKDLEILSASGIAETATGQSWNVAESGLLLGSGTTSTMTYSRVFAGSNADLANSAVVGDANDIAQPSVYDVIPAATPDLTGIPGYDSAPEVIVNCAVGSTVSVYDAITGSFLASAPCGTSQPSEPDQSSSLAYIPVPSIAASTTGAEATPYTTVVVSQAYPGSGNEYVSPSDSPPQVQDITVSGSSATFTYNTPVSCPATDSLAVDQFKYAFPDNTLNFADWTFPSSISCSNTDQITVTFSSAIPTGQLLLFKYEGEGTGEFIVAAPSSPIAGEREASQSAIVQGNVGSPDAAVIDNFSGPSSIGSAGGQVTFDFTTNDATSCSLAVSPSGPQLTDELTDGNTQTPSELDPVSDAPSLPYCSIDGVVEAQIPANTTSVPTSFTFTLSASSAQGTVATAQLSVSEAAGTQNSGSGTSGPAPTGPVGSTGPTGTGGPSGVAGPTGPTGTSGTTNSTLPAITSVSPSTGPTAGGTRVTITGRNFARKVTVRFGAKTAKDVRVVSSTEILATSPAGSGSVSITVHTATGTSATTSSDRFTYSSALRPVVRSLKVGAMGRNGRTITILGAHFMRPIVVKVGSHLANDVVVHSSTRLTAVAPKVRGTFTVTVSTRYGVSSDHLKAELRR